jgi:hypothetical protein
MHSAVSQDIGQEFKMSGDDLVSFVCTQRWERNACEKEIRNYNYDAVHVRKFGWLAGEKLRRL